ncbi:MAG: tRNA (adenosine(37)-N6)-threonylcarbamoyltransferase complex ATPase subunit type 1 TsaE [Muribaculaceae bacterium]|jgi:tRNA threonylcarbamoyladenosine biosynthesis protein TsaE|nr:tRNA (adenosine(37)-N6)-threonylcarbamoyltransferase complex ATPase subunit type 1 TsaE [Muribaculaceae bacterium]GFI14713.1 tRNA threonylcarbamoyladenosine biosynthesis protein TsaE [Muribaculaceae bacterium]
MKTIEIPSLEALPEAARSFAALMGDNTVFAFYGDMGAGKTTFINALSEALGVEPGETASPTFALINEYRSDTTAELIYHFDFYRIEDLEEALELGIEDYFDSGAVCLIEWPERIAAALPADTVTVRISVNDDDSRTLTISE